MLIQKLLRILGEAIQILGRHVFRIAHPDLLLKSRYASDPGRQPPAQDRADIRGSASDAGTDQSAQKTASTACGRAFILILALGFRLGNRPANIQVDLTRQPSHLPDQLRHITVFERIRDDQKGIILLISIQVADAE